MEPKEDEAAERCGFDDCDDGMFELYGSYCPLVLFPCTRGLPKQTGVREFERFLGGFYIDILIYFVGKISGSYTDFG